MMLAITGEALFFFKPSESTPCSICPEENFCPEGPEFYLKVNLKDVKNLLNP